MTASLRRRRGVLAALVSISLIIWTLGGWATDFGQAGDDSAFAYLCVALFSGLWLFGSFLWLLISMIGSSGAKVDS